VKTKTIHPKDSTPKNLLLMSARASEDPELRHRIAEKAYELYQQRGCVHGHDGEDWLEAERLVLSEGVGTTLPLRVASRV